MFIRPNASSKANTVGHKGLPSDTIDLPGKTNDTNFENT